MAYWEFLAFDDAWDHFLYPWFKTLSRTPPSQLPNVVIVPNTSLVSFLKQKLIQHQLSYIDLHFYTPSLLRQKLASLLSIHAKTLLREDFHLLIKCTCSQFPTNPLAKASCHEPEPLAHLIDSVLASEIDFSFLPIPEAIPIMHSLLKHILPKNILTSQLLDKQILEDSSNKRHFFENTLILGFTAQSWNHFSLLKAAFLSSAHPTLCFPMNQPDTLIERAWQGTWESLSVPVELVPFSSRSPYVDFANSFENAPVFEQNSYKVPPLTIEKSKLTEANSIFKQIVSWLKVDSAIRIGIIFPAQNSPLARMLSTILSDFNFPHHNTVHSPCASSKEERAFRSLIAFLTNPVLNTLFDFLHSLQVIELITLADLLQIKKDCHQAFLKIDTDALVLIINYINLTHPQHPLNKILETFPLLENEATFSEFFQKITPLLKKINYPPNLISLTKQSSIPQFILEKHISKEWFLTWLLDVVVLMHTTAMNELTTYPYANIHLLTPIEAASQSWTHLIFAELENTNWTLINKDIPYLSHKDIHLLNTFICGQGPFGANHFIVKPNCIPFTLSSELSILAENNFAHLFHLATDSIVCTSTYDTLSSVPIISPLLEKMIHLTKSSSINKEDSTDDQSYLSLLAKNFAQSTTAQCENAYLNRQDSTTPFNTFSFSFENDLPKDMASISCKNWELVLTKPEIAWMKVITKTERQTNYAIEDASRIMMGSWAHDWICLKDCKNGNFIAKPQKTTWIQYANTKAYAELASLKGLYTSIQQTVPNRLLSKWYCTLQITDNWIKTISNHSDIAYVASEYLLPHNTCVCVENICKIPVTGRLDLVARDDHSNEKRLWVIDFKTGNPSPLTTHNFLQGKGLQLVLYALALASNTGGIVDFSYLQPFSPLKRQYSFEDLNRPLAELALEKGGKGASEHRILTYEFIREDLSTEGAHPSSTKVEFCKRSNELIPLWHALKLIHEKGIFGQKEFARFNHVSNAPEYPIATLTIPNSVLSKKWNLTHSNLITRD